jgi:hypothetical protein
MKQLTFHKKENPYTYIANAKEILRTKAQKKGEFYSIPKYVRMAGDTAWHGVLLAIDYWMEKEGHKINRKKGVNVSYYQDFLAQKNLKILNYFNSAYNYLHLLMGYDGDLLVDTSKKGIELAEEILNWVKKYVPELGKEK